MLKLTKECDDATTPQRRSQLERIINSIDWEIDSTVFRLYGLSAKEVELIRTFEGTGDGPEAP
jgi:hypothetical protein